MTHGPPTWSPGPCRANDEPDPPTQGGIACVSSEPSASHVPRHAAPATGGPGSSSWCWGSLPQCRSPPASRAPTTGAHILVSPRRSPTALRDGVSGRRQVGADLEHNPGWIPGTAGDRDPAAASEATPTRSSMGASSNSLSSIRGIPGWGADRRRTTDHQDAESATRPGSCSPRGRLAGAPSQAQGTLATRPRRREDRLEAPHRDRRRLVRWPCLAA